MHTFVWHIVRKTEDKLIALHFTVMMPDDEYSRTPKTCCDPGEALQPH